MNRDNQIMLDAWIKFGIGLFVALGALGGIVYLIRLI